MRRIYADRGESADRDHIIRKPNSTIVLLFIKNISKFFTSLPPRRRSSKLWPVSRHGLRILKFKLTCCRHIVEADFVCHKSNVNSFTSQNSKS